MEKKTKSNFIKGTLVAGALLSLSALSATPNASSLFDYNALGSGSEVRSEILHTEANPFSNFEAKCGEKKEAKSEGKKAEGKCGEGKCGDKKAAKKTKDAKATKTKASKKVKTTETKAKEAKCGEGTCGVE